MTGRWPADDRPVTGSMARKAVGIGPLHGHHARDMARRRQLLSRLHLATP
jgi:hypothetical protein